MLEFLDRWLEHLRQDGILQRLEEYWIRGREAEQSTQRWTVIRDVLGWVD